MMVSQGVLYGASEMLVDAAGAKLFDVVSDYYTFWRVSKSMVTSEVPELLFYGIRTPYQTALQDFTEEALSAAVEVSKGKKLYRLGTRNVSAAAEGQFWSMENPLDNPSAYASKYGIPIDNIKNADFLEIGTIKPDVEFITRAAPAAPGSPVGSGGGIEVVTPANGVKLESFHTLK